MTAPESNTFWVIAGTEKVIGKPAVKDWLRNMNVCTLAFPWGPTGPVGPAGPAGPVSPDFEQDGKTEEISNIASVRQM